MTTAQVIKVTETNADQVIPFLHKWGWRPKEEWKALFSYPLLDEHPYFGLALIENGEVTGFIGTIFAKRTIQDQTEIFCNITTWKVEENSRQHSMTLLMPILGLTKVTITNFSPTSPVAEMFAKLRFQELSRVYWVKPYFPVVMGHKLSYVSSRDVKQAEKLASQNELLQFHSSNTTKSTWLTIKNEKTSVECIIVYTKVKKRRLSVVALNYVSNPEFFLKHATQISNRILKLESACLVQISDHLVHDQKVALSIRRKRQGTSCFRSKTLTREQIDTLYSECVILGVN